MSISLKKYLKLKYSQERVNILAITNIILLILLFFIFLFPFSVQSDIDVFFPRIITSDVIGEDNLIITITAENVIYLNKELATLKELSQELVKNKGHSVLIKAEHRTSLGRIVEVWDICRSLGIEKINLATKQEGQ
ncbi:MAG TPA: biopolymer transporter ExbD [Candidatus Omnitrophota bacterium]|nr:biopolymer transporter ExbD [Candidatus Omnitrophota bacterium]HPN87960.1 biopolymer transporter ExbD [Candidatus Omnitrophota bacterium]